MWGISEENKSFGICMWGGTEGFPVKKLSQYFFHSHVG